MYDYLIMHTIYAETTYADYNSNLIFIIVILRISSHICSNCVKSIFIVAGGNEVEYATTPQAFAKFLDNCNGLLDLIAIQYPNASINIMSLIPRSSMHISIKISYSWLCFSFCILKLKQFEICDRDMLFNI